MTADTAAQRRSLTHTIAQRLGQLKRCRTTPVHDIDGTDYVRVSDLADALVIQNQRSAEVAGLLPHDLGELTALAHRLSDILDAVELTPQSLHTARNSYVTASDLHARAVIPWDTRTGGDER